MPSYQTVIVGSLVLALGFSAGGALAPRGSRRHEFCAIGFMFFYSWALVMALFA